MGQSESLGICFQKRKSPIPNHTANGTTSTLPFALLQNGSHAFGVVLDSDCPGKIRLLF